MPKGPDPRHAPAPLAHVPALLSRGADAFNERRFWDAHEAWEEAWHGLRAHKPELAEHLHGMILVAAALENATRKKESGFKRQLAEGLYLLQTHRAARDSLLVDGAAWVDGLVTLYADACRRREWAWWNDAPWQAPVVRVAPVLR